MNEIKKRYLHTSTALMAALLLLTAGVACADITTLQISATPGLQAGQVRDGTLLLSGRIALHSAHSGFRLRCNGQPEAGRPDICLLQGQRNSGHQLRVRLTGAGWQPREDGTMIYISDDSAPFRVEADGNQHVAADTWTVALSASVID